MAQLIGTNYREGNIIGSNKLHKYQQRYIVMADLMRPDLERSLKLKSNLTSLLHETN